MTNNTEQQAVPVAQSPASIWLSPICDDTADHGEGRTWASLAPEATCEDCGLPWVKYVRADLTPATDATQTREAEGEQFAKIAECAFDDRPRSRVGHPSQMDWEDGYQDGTRAAAAAIRAALDGRGGA